MSQDSTPTAAPTASSQAQAGYTPSEWQRIKWLLGFTQDGQLNEDERQTVVARLERGFAQTVERVLGRGSR